MTAARSALIVGAGIAGPVTAMALQKAGIDAVIYEAQPGTADRIGAFLTVASNGLDALRTIAADGRVLDCGFPTPSITLRSSKGRHLGKARTGWSLPDDTISHTIKRSDLYRALYTEAVRRGVGIEHNKRLTSVRETARGIEAAFADGSVATSDVLIGCDGVHSTVRQLIDPTAPTPDYLGLLSVGGYATGVKVAIEPGSYEMIFGRRAFFGYALAPDEQVWWFANLPHRSEPTRSDLQAIGRGDRHRHLLDVFKDDSGPAHELISASRELSPASAIHALPHLPNWHTDRMIVIGDAAHAPSPTSGQGASLAFEDAIALAKLLRDSPSPHTAFGRFQTERRPRVEKIIKQATRMSSSKAAGPVGRTIRDAMMPMIMKIAANANDRSLKRTCGYHIDWDDHGSDARPPVTPS